ncbi:MAG: hypothetical protein P8X88_02640 [Gammaproteobacteria bacterium]
MDMNKLFKGLTVAGLIAFSGSSFAVTQDGTLDATSTGTVDIDVTIGDLIQISGLVPMTGTTYTPGGPVNYSTPACVYRNSGAGYDVTATSSTAGGAGANFLLNGTSANVVYTVNYNDGVTSGALTNGTLNASFANANQTIADCSIGAGGNVTVSVSIPEVGAGPLNGLAEVPADTYTDELSILVAPR